MSHHRPVLRRGPVGVLPEARRRHCSRDLRFVLPAGRPTRCDHCRLGVCRGHAAVGPTPEGLEASILEMTKRFSEAERRLRAEASPKLLAEVFPGLPAGPRRPGDWHRRAHEDTRCRCGRSRMTPPICVAGARHRVDGRRVDCVRPRRLVGPPAEPRVINLRSRGWATARFLPFLVAAARADVQSGLPEAHRGSIPAAPPADCVKRRDFADSYSAAEIERSCTTQARLPDVAAELWWEQRSAQPARWERDVAPPFERRFYRSCVKLQSQPVRRAESVQVGLATVTWLDEFKTRGLDERRLLRAAESLGHGPWFVFLITCCES